MTLKEVLDGVAEDIYELVGYRVRDNKGKAYGILYSAMDDIERSAVVGQLENNKGRSFSDIVESMADELYDFVNGKNTSFMGILTYYTPLLEQAVAVDKYINESADNIMEDYPEDGGMQEKTDFFIGLKEKKKLIESKLVAINNVLQQVMPELIGWIEANPTTELVGTNGKKAHTRTTYYPSVVDLVEFKKSVAEQWSRFEGVNSKELGKLIKEIRNRATLQGIDFHDILPSGVAVAKNVTLTVSAPGSKTKHSSEDGMDELVNMIIGKGEDV